jgi:cold shock CspA family protein
MTETSTPATDCEKFIGCVKWFNNKAGYGFITIKEGIKSGSDIFIHHSAIEVENQQYKYLVQGEYVEFELIKTTSTVHEWQASSVNGINGGKLMCETRREYKMAKTAYRADKNEPEEASSPRAPRDDAAPRQQRPPRDSTAPRQQHAPRVRGEGPRDGGDKKEWTLVSKNADNKVPRNVRSKTTRQGATVITIESK